MHLRAITLSGFKTFARSTEIRFEAGVTAIVGPNGSGKSNIVDSFRWVLGETSAKDLRGKRMDEVIYAGGERRGKASHAEVEIVIDNSDRRLPVDYEEVAIRRRIDRSGQSDYFLNGSRVRRRDLMDLLASTGLTTDSYAIVAQKDIEQMISATPEQRRVLIEEAAQVRGVKQKRSEAGDRLKELAANLLRLEDLRGEIEPRLEVVRAQAALAREAQEAQARLDLLRGSIVFEEWREARDAHRRSAAQLQSLERKLVEAKEAADLAERDYQAGKLQVQAAQDRRLERQRAVNALRLTLSGAEHDLALAGERAHSQAALAAAAAAEQEELRLRAEAAAGVRAQLERDLEAAQAALAAVPEAAPEPQPGNAAEAKQARRDADAARRELASAHSSLTSVKTRRQFLEETAARLEAQVKPAEAALEGAVGEAGRAARQAAEARDAASELAGVRAELKALEALRPSPAGGLKRVGDVIVAKPGHEAALSAVLGPLVDAWVAAGEAAALAAVEAAESQATVLYPVPGAQVEDGSLFAHVTCDRGFEELGRRLLGSIVLGRDVTAAGVLRQPGLVRAGNDARVRLTTRRRQLEARLAELEPVAADAARLGEEVRRLEARVNELKTAAGARPRLEETLRQLEQVRAQEAQEAGRMPELESRTEVAEKRAAELSRAIDEYEKLLAEHRAEVRRLELERLRWSERRHDLERQRNAVDSDLGGLAQAAAARAERVQAAAAAAAEVEARLPGLQAAVEAARAQLAEAEQESPEEEAELAAGARTLVTLEEARVDARLRAGTLEGNLGLIVREVELLEQRMEEIRTRMPEGLAPEEIPGGKAREREMRQLERRLEEIGPTNPLAEAECSELEERFSTLHEQLDDIGAARRDLEQLVARLREEEDTRYEAVFGAVAANFQEYFGTLTAGGKATLMHAPGDDGPRSGVDILVQPPRKRLQNVSLLSSGERSLTALAMVLALQEVNPAPFTIMDEVDAALDDANVARFGEVLQNLGRLRQFLVITHNHLTMASASGLYGVHLDESGSSHLVSVRLEDIRPARRFQAAASA